MSQCFAKCTAPAGDIVCGCSLRLKLQPFVVVVRQLLHNDKMTVTGGWIWSRSNALRLLGFITFVAVGGCANTATQLAAEKPDATWVFSTNLETTSQCLAGTLNREWQPQSAAAQFFGRSISHSVIVIEPSRINHIVHEHAGPSTMWLFVVSSVSPKLTQATVHVGQNLAREDNLAKMERAAGSCGGTRG